MIVLDLVAKADFFLFLLLLKTVFFAHDLVEAVWLEIKYVGEGAEGVDFVVLERVEVEADPLKMHDKNVRCCCNHCALL